MSSDIRAATLSDLPQMIALLMEDARRRRTVNPKLWALAGDAGLKVEAALRFALTAERQPFRQKWLVASAGEKLVGVIHTMLLPVPPIYAGRWGDPGLVMPECFVAEGAPSGTVEALAKAAEEDLLGAGARLLLASVVSDEKWRSCFAGRSYEPLTLYLAKTGFTKIDLERTGAVDCARPASENDIAGIVRRSAENRTVLAELDAFWTPHPNADARFADWMRRSLTLKDRDMLVAGSAEDLDGYVIAQPASQLHFPPAHDTIATGTIDDYFHREFSDPARMQEGGEAATHLLREAETAFAGRGVETAMVVCPAAWASKISVLETAGYETAMVWMIKR